MGKKFLKNIISYFLQIVIPNHVKGFLIEIDNFKFICHVQDMEVTRKLFFLKSYENKEITLIQNLINKKSEIIFLGAHIGVHVIRIAGSVEKIHAVEANPNTFELLKTNCNLNNLKNVELYNCAVGEKDGSIQFLANTVNTGGSKRLPIKKNRIYYDKNTQIIESKLQTGDYLFSKINKIDLIIMDIEGSEYFALLGMKKTLQKTKFLIIEFLPHHIKNVSSTPINEYVNLITKYFNHAYIPSQGKYLRSPNEIKNELEIMYYNNIEDDGVVLSKNKFQFL